MADQQVNPRDLTQTVGMAATKDAQGNWWVAVTHSVGALSITYGIPLDAADETADAYAANLKSLAAEARRERSGLTVVKGNGKRR